MRITTYRTKLTENKRIALEKEISVNYPDIDAIRSPANVYELATGYLRMHEESEEYLYLVCTNVKNKVIGVFEISHGNVNSSIFGVREILQKALLANAVNIIMIHNHPSGDPSPSREDIAVTERLRDAGKLVGIELLDHIIVGDSGFCSLKERGNI